MDIDEVYSSYSGSDNVINGVSFFAKSIKKSAFYFKLVRFINKYLIFLNLRAICNRYAAKVSIYFLKQDEVLYSEYDKNAIFLNIGSGAFAHPKWTNLDLEGVTAYYKDIQGVKGVDFNPIDLTEKDFQLAYDSNSVSLIYCSHVIEHLELESGYNLLKEVYRVLDDKGIARFVIPKTDYYYSLLNFVHIKDGNENCFSATCLKNFAKFINDDSTKLSGDKLNELFLLSDADAFKLDQLITSHNGCSPKFSHDEPGRHISFWNLMRFNKLAKEIGFSYMLPVVKGQSLAKPFLNGLVFDDSEPHLSHYIELVK